MIASPQTKKAASWYTFATENVFPTDSGEGNYTVNIQIAESADFDNWNLIQGGDGRSRDALPNPPEWVDRETPNIWAPDVIELDDGTFVMYFSGSTTANSTRHCIGAATSTDILGPYTPGAEPLICPLDQGGAIDAAGFKDWSRKGAGWGHKGHQGDNDVGWKKWRNGPRDWRPDSAWGPNPYWRGGGSPGRRWVVYKIDGGTLAPGGNTCDDDGTITDPVPTPLLLQEVGADGVSLIGGVTQLLDNAGRSDDFVIEAPDLVKSAEGTYFLFFSGGCYQNDNYTVDYAVSTGDISGPYERRGPLLQTGDRGLIGPGGADIHWDSRHIVFHANAAGNEELRQMYVGQINIDGQTVTI
ncbi:MAG: hypothetical protein M1831_006426 [Alyxoria varia]|nr:MAG: hypothetical protein M1831_006426 [Alyxoria varia]